MKIARRSRVIRYTDLACPVCSAPIGKACEPGLNNFGPRKPHTERTALMRAIKHGTKAPQAPTPLDMPAHIEEPVMMIQLVDSRPNDLRQDEMDDLYDEAEQMDIEFDCDDAEIEAREVPWRNEHLGDVQPAILEEFGFRSHSGPVVTPPPAPLVWAATLIPETPVERHTGTRDFSPEATGFLSEAIRVVDPETLQYAYVPSAREIEERDGFLAKIEQLQVELDTYRRLWKTFASETPEDKELFVQEVHFLAVNALSLKEENEDLRYENLVLKRQVR